MKNIQKANRLKMLAGLALIAILAVQLASLIYYQAKVSSLNTELHNQKLSAQNKSDEELQAEHYATQTATLVSPHTMRLKMDKGEVDFVLIDVRAADDYKRGHIRGAINIPFDGSSEAIEKFRQALADGKKERKTYGIIYCYSYACMLGAKTGNELAKHNIFVKELSIGYNDWEMQHKVWNNPGEIYDINHYIERSDQPGELKASQEFLSRPCSESDKFSC